MTFTAPRPAATEANTIEAGTYRLRCLSVSDPYVADNFEKTEQVWQCDIVWSIEGDLTGEETDFDGMEINQRFVKCGYLPKNTTLTPGTPATPQNFKLVTDDRATFTKVITALLGSEWEELAWTDPINKRLIGDVVLKENGYPKINSFLPFGKKKTAAKPAAIAPKAKAAPVADEVPPPADPDDDF